MKVAGVACAAAAAAGLDKAAIRETIAALVADPKAYAVDPHFGALADAIAGVKAAQQLYVPRAEAAPWRQWGTDLEPSAVDQLRNACNLPVAVAGALMPDAHQGYGLPIGGVLATDNAVIPFAVGVDIACRMKLTVLDLPISALTGQRGRLVNALEKETFFGVGAGNRGRRQHAVMDEDWTVTAVTTSLKDRAADQLGTSGSGNHFAEFGTLTRMALPSASLSIYGNYVCVIWARSTSRGFCMRG